MPQSYVANNNLGLENNRAKQMRFLTIANGGGTFTAMGTPISPKFGFVLSLDPDRGVVVPQDEFTRTTLQTFAMNNQPYIYEFNNSDPEGRKGVKMLGTWVHNGQVHLDVVTVIVTKGIDEVMELARENNQLAIYDFATGKSIDVKP